ncbi:hypothetical protein RN629_13575 [Sphingomonadaceae bacterium jetA1]|jgi:hypothetical protein|uniref:hypothetical protein n=1 Tax=Facivitalis istanbulensis TaxID=3075838 RepID=UPI003472C2DC
MPVAILTAAATPVAPVPRRPHPEWSDIALFVAAVAAVWFLRRTLRRRHRKD